MYSKKKQQQTKKHVISHDNKTENNQEIICTYKAHNYIYTQIDN